MATNTYEIEYAKTGRSGCKDKDCKKSGNNKIEAGEMRIGKNSPNPFSDGDTKLDWYHPACWFATQGRMRAGSKKVESTDDLEGYEKLKADDKAIIKDLIAGKGVGAGGKKKAAAKKTAGKKRKAGSDDDDDDEEEEKPKKKAAAKKKKKAAASDDDDDEGSEDEKPKKKKAKAAPKKKKAASDDDDDEGSDDEKPKKKAAAKKKSGGGGGGGGDKKRYEMDEKFWEVSVDGDEMTVTFGKIGSKGQTQTKSFANKAAAEKEAAKLIKQKEGKGYTLQD